MPITDASGHVVPAGSDALARSNFLNLSASVNDIKQVGNSTERAQLLVALAAATPPFVPTAARRLFVQQTDTGIIWEHSGTGWTPLALAGNSWSARKGASQSLTASTYTDILAMTLTDAPAGTYSIRGQAVTYAGAAGTHYREVRWGGTALPGGGDGISCPANLDNPLPTTLHTVTHTGGTVVVMLRVQVNAGSAFASSACALQVDYIGR